MYFFGFVKESPKSENKMVKEFEVKMGMLSFIKDVYKWVSAKHQGQMYGDSPYIDHIHDVYKVIDSYKIFDVDIIVAALCHDILEDTTTTYNDLKEVIGAPAADIVYDVTNELGKNRKERALKTYPKIASNPKAIIVKIADRIANTRYSKESGSTMFDKYCREFPDFKSHLYSSASLEAFPVLIQMWEELEKLSTR